MMDREKIAELLEAYRTAQLTLDEAVGRLSAGASEDLGFAHLDHGRVHRCGIPEFIFGEGKTSAQIVEIAGKMVDKGLPVFVTRVKAEQAEALLRKFDRADYNEQARTVAIGAAEPPGSAGDVAVITAGTSDVPVAEEVLETAAFLGASVERFYDIGVAGIHRLAEHLDAIRAKDVAVVVAGMEGALASVVGGLFCGPVIGVPTSVGYGVSFHGMTALFGMLTSCAANVCAVNIDNGFGAGVLAAIIGRMAARGGKKGG